MGTVHGGAILILILICLLIYIVRMRIESERVKRQKHEEWMTQTLAGAGGRAEGDPGFVAAVKRRAEKGASESKPRAPNFTMPSSPYEEAIKPKQKPEQKWEPIFGKRKEPIFNWERIWERIKGLKLSRTKFPDLGADAQRYRIYGLYVVLILAGVLFIPEAREWAGARVAENWVWLGARASDAVQWFSARYAEGQATGTATREFVVDHFTVIWESAALLVLAGLFLKFGKRAGIVGAVGCVLVAGYLGEREYVFTQIAGLPWLASLGDKGTIPNPTPVASPYLDTKTLCGRALVTSQDRWDQSAIYKADAVEAQKRGLTIESCRVALGLSSSALSEPVPTMVPTPTPTVTVVYTLTPTPTFTPNPQPSPTVPPEEIGIARIDTPNSDWKLDANRRYWLQLNVGRTVFSIISGAISITNDDGSVVLSCSNDPIFWVDHALNGAAMLVSACFGQPAEFRVPEINGLTAQVPDVAPTVIPAPSPAPTKTRRRGSTDAWSNDPGHYSRGR